MDIFDKVYDELIAQGMDKELANKHKRIDRFLSNCDDIDFCKIFDSGIFRDITLGYFKMALLEHEKSSQEIEEILNTTRRLFTNIRPKELL